MNAHRMFIIIRNDVQLGCIEYLFGYLIYLGDFARFQKCVDRLIYLREMLIWYCFSDTSLGTWKLISEGNRQSSCSLVECAKT